MGYVARVGEIRNTCRIFIGKPEGRNHFEGEVENTSYRKLVRI